MWEDFILEHWRKWLVYILDLLWTLRYHFTDRTVNSSDANTKIALVYTRAWLRELCSLSKSVQTAHYIKRGLGEGSICEVRTARRDTRNVGRTAFWPSPCQQLVSPNCTLLSAITWMEWTLCWEQTRSGDPCTETYLKCFSYQGPVSQHNIPAWATNIEGGYQHTWYFC